MQKNQKPIILGGGPAGLSAALKLSSLKIKHTLIEKSPFPRDKICGDALSGKVLNALKKKFPDCYSGLIASERSIPSFGVSFFSPNGNKIDLPFKKIIPPGTPPPGFVAKRIDFDNLLFENLSDDFTNLVYAEAGDVEITNEGVYVFGRDGKMLADGNIIISSEGSRSLVAKKYAGYRVNQKHYCAGLRQYYNGVADLHPENYIELHFLNELLPGYFWIFPLPNGQANVGMGMLSSHISKHSLNIKHIFRDIIQQHPVISSRFKHAAPLEEIKGWGLPLGSAKLTLAGNRFLITGDAASLIDPFTGEGISNAINSGIAAAEWTGKAIFSDDFSADFLNNYSQEIYKAMWPELKTSYNLQQASRIKPLFNWIVNRANNSQFFKNTLIDMFNQTDLRNELTNPLFYFKLLFR